MKMNFYKCDLCGNTLTPLLDSGVGPVCCGQDMDLLKAGTGDGAVEKHVPVIEREDDGHHITVSVGSAPHPMTKEHYIQFVVLAYGSRFDFRLIDAEEDQTTRFSIKDNSIPLIAYAYCNLHGLYEAEI